MGVEVDSVIVDLEARLGQYRQNMREAISLQRQYQAGWGEPANDTAIAKTAAEAKKAVAEVARTTEQSDQRISASRKKRAADSAASDRAEVASTKRAAKEKADAEIAEAERSARYRAMAERAVAGTRVAPGSGRIPNSDLSRGGSPLFIPPSVLNGGAQAEKAALTDVAAARRDIAINEARLVGLQGKEADEIERELAYLRTYVTLKARGVEETEAQLLAERAITVQQEKQVAGGLFRRSATRGGLGEANQFALGASRGRFGYSFTPGAVAGIGAAIGGTLAIGAIESATKYGQALSEVSKQAGLSAEQLQVYQHAAQQAGVENDQFNSALQTFTENLGKARTGSKEQSKAFAALGVDIHTAATAGDLLPTLIDRISSIPDAAKRARVETALFGATGEKLDSMLSGGNQRINELAKALEDTGAILSSSDIARLDDTSRKLAEVKAQLAVDVAQIVADNAQAIERLASAFASLAGSIPGALRWLDQMNNRLDVAGGWFQKNILANAAEGAGFYNLAEAYRQAGTENMQSGGNALGRDALHGGVNGNAAVGQSLLSSVLHPTTVQNGSVNNRLLNKLGAGSGRKRHGPTAEQLQAQADARDRRYASEERQLQEQRLSALSDLTGDTRQQDEYQRERVRLEQQARDKDYDLEADQEIARGKLKGAAADEIRARAENLKKLNDANADLDIQGINRKEQSRYLDEQLEKQRTTSKIESDRLTNESALADTTAERRRIALRQLEIDRQNEEASLNRVIEDKSSSPEAVANAQTRLSALPSIYGGKQADVMRQTETSLDAYKRSLEVTADTISDFGVHILQDFNSELDHSITKALHLHGIFGEIVGDLIDMAVKQQLIGPLANSGGFGGFLGSIGKLFGLGGAGLDVGGITSATNSLLDAGLPGLSGARASGGPVVAGGRYLVGERGPEVLEMPGNGFVYPNGVAMNQKVAAANSQPIIQLSQSVHIDASGVNPEGYTKGILGVVRHETAEAIRQSQAQVLAAVPGRVQRSQTLGS